MNHLICRLLGHKWIPNAFECEGGPDWFCERCPAELVDTQVTCRGCSKLTIKYWSDGRHAWYICTNKQCPVWQNGKRG